MNPVRKRAIVNMAQHVGLILSIPVLYVIGIAGMVLTFAAIGLILGAPALAVIGVLGWTFGWFA